MWLATHRDFQNLDTYVLESVDAVEYSVSTPWQGREGILEHKGDYVCLRTGSTLRNK